MLGALLWPSLEVPLVFQLLEVLVEMGSNLMQVDDQILSQAQKEKSACSSIVCSLETLAWPQLHLNAQDLSMVGDSLGLKVSRIIVAISSVQEPYGKEIDVVFSIPECTAVCP